MCSWLCSVNTLPMVAVVCITFSLSYYLKLHDIDITINCTVEPRYKEVGYNKTLAGPRSLNICFVFLP